MSPNPTEDLGAGVAAALLVAAIVAAARALRRVSIARERAVASFAGGVSLAFVMLELLVELVEGTAQDLRVRAGPQPVHTIATLVLVGACVAFAASLYGERHRHGWRNYAIAAAPQLGYRALVGAALVEELHISLRAFVVFWLAMVLHLGIAEHRLDAAWPRAHRGPSRLAVLAAPLFGAGFWAWAEPTLATFHVLLALVAGATILGIFREEIPSLRETRAFAFFSGVVAFSVIVQARWWM